MELQEILFAAENGPIYRVAASGGSPVAVTKLENESSHRFPRFLPDGRHFLYLAIGESSTVFVGDLMAGTAKRLFVADSGAVYVPSGFVLFIRQDVLLAQEFDAGKLETVGDPKPLAEPVAYVAFGPNVGLASFSASTNGILTYRTGTSTALDNVKLTWVDRSGKELQQIGKAAPYRGVDLSPDGKRLAVHQHDGAGGDIWVFEPQRPTPLRLTFDASQENASPIWSPDGKQIAFASLRAGMWGIYQKRADGSGDERQLFQTKLLIMPMSWAPDSQSLIFTQRDTSLGDLWTLPLEDAKKAQPLLHSNFNESHGQISPDGKWISYNSNESGRPEIYVRPFPSGSGKWQVSSNGGVFSRWRPDGKEIFYLSANNNGKMMAVEVKNSGSTFVYETAKELFDSQYLNYGHGRDYHTFAVSPDGQRFLIPRPVESSSDTSSNAVTVVLNWTSLLKK
jgi:eukaryotic-like serine/threonine-protein kinase